MANGQNNSRSGRQPAWLLLVHQLPTRPSNARVKTWRRLQKLGALALKSSAYVLPNSPQAREDFEWIKAEIVAMKGQAMVFAADNLDSLSAEELVAGFRSARQRDYDQLRVWVTRLLDRSARRGARVQQGQRLERTARLMRQRLAEIEAVDFFKAEGSDEAAAALVELELLAKGGGTAMVSRTGKQERLRIANFQNRLWVTRPRPGIDRMACAWLIRRFIDSRARFDFAHKPKEARNAVPFDMFGVEFSHLGDTCSFETLARRFGITGRPIEWLAHIVHELDLKDGKYNAPEAAVVGRLVEGLRLIYADDHELLERGVVLFEALHRSLSDLPARKGSSRAGAGGKRRILRAGRR
jgi:hypothetical protein